MIPPAKFDDRLRRIDSRQNARVKSCVAASPKLLPNDQGEIAVEGMHLVEEAIRSGLAAQHGLLQRVGPRARS